MTTAASSQLVLLGPPGAGKGTQAELLSARLGTPHISTGDMLRVEISRGSELGQRAKGFMDKGDLVPDELMLGIVRQRLSAADCERGFVLDGFPRSVPQAVSLDEICGNSTRGLRAVSLEVPTDELVRRLAERRTCRLCGAMYHLSFEPPKRPGICDKCGGELYQRDDDREEIVTARLEVYRKATAPLLQFYRERKALLPVDGTGSTEQVNRRIVASLGIPA
ncbi:MAG: adenylate kinase [Thermodesulfobacteriota bacterium]